MKIVTLTLSCAFDIHCTADKLTVNHENLASIVSCDAGGKGVNISRALTKFGVENTAVAVLGEENGDSFERALKNEGMALYPIWDKGRIRENITVHTDDGRETRLSFRGSSASEGVFSKVTDALRTLCDSETLLTVTGRVPDGIELDSVKALIKELADKGVKVVIDSRSFTLSDLVEAKPYLIKPNEEEIETYMGRHIGNADEAVLAAAELHALGIENVMISLGGEGAVIVSRDGTYYQKAPDIVPVSTIGAGDSSIAGFLMGLSIGEGIGGALKRAVAFGSGACLTPGTNPPTPDDVYVLMKEMN